MLIPPTPSWKTYIVLVKASLSRASTIIRRRHKYSFLLSLALYAPVSYVFFWLDTICLKFFPSKRTKIDRPVFIVGTPRSGSTLLHRLLLECSDDLFAITHYEWRYPSYLLQLFLSFFGFKFLASKKNYWSGDSHVSSMASSMHPNLIGDHEEDAILFEERVGFHPYLFLHFPLKGLLSYFAGFDDENKPSFSSRRCSAFLSFYKHVIRCVSLLHPDKLRFLSKEVASNGRISLLRETFPDALFIVITRYPSNYLSSLKELLKISTHTKTGCSLDELDDRWWSEWVDWLAFEANASARAYREMLPSNSCVHVEFNDLIANPHDVIARLQGFLSSPPSPMCKEILDSHVANQRIRERGYSYQKVDFDGSQFSFFLDTFYSA